MIAVELRKQLPRARTWVALLVMAVVPVIMTVGFAVGGAPHDHRDGPDLFSLATQSGLNMPLTALAAMENFLLVVVVALFAGETVAGEASWGSLRYLLLRPVTRARLLTAKVTVAALLSVLATLVIPVVALAAGVAAFGWHPLVTPFAGTLGELAALWRLFAASGYVAWSMAGVVAFAFMVSTMTDAPFGPVFAGLALAVVSEILDAIPAFGAVRYGLPTHYWHAWDGLFLSPIQGGDMVRGVLIQLPYAAVFLAVAYVWFTRKDVLS